MVADGLTKKEIIMDPMALVTPAIGLMFWTCVVFTLLVILLRKFAWKPILTAVDERNSTIEDALQAAEKAKTEMAELTSNNEKIIAEAKKERDGLLKEAREMKEQIVVDAKNQANTEADKIITAAKEQIANEKMKAVTELKNHVAELSIAMAEKIVRAELSDADKQKEFVANALKTNQLN